jgi:hypothetical protein
MRDRGLEMNDESFDEVSKALAAPLSRRRAVKLVAATAGGTMLSLLGARTASAVIPGRCRNAGTICRESAECCSGLCDVNTRRCVCQPPRVNDRGRCVCPSGTASCGASTEFAQCCPPELCCENAFCCGPGTHCSTCDSFFTTCCPDGTNCVCDPWFGCQCI